jgi:hypothetical protein
MTKRKYFLIIFLSGLQINNKAKIPQFPLLTLQKINPINVLQYIFGIIFLLKTYLEKQKYRTIANDRKENIKKLINGGNDLIVELKNEKSKNFIINKVLYNQYNTINNLTETVKIQIQDSTSTPNPDTLLNEISQQKTQIENITLEKYLEATTKEFIVFLFQFKNTIKITEQEIFHDFFKCKNIAQDDINKQQQCKSEIIKRLNDFNLQQYIDEKNKKTITNYYSKGNFLIQMWQNNIQINQTTKQDSCNFPFTQNQNKIYNKFNTKFNGFYHNQNTIGFHQFKNAKNKYYENHLQCNSLYYNFFQIMNFYKKIT